MSTPIPTLLRDRDIAPLFGVTPRTVRIWAEEGRLPTPVINEPRCKRWHPDDIARWVDKRRSR